MAIFLWTLGGLVLGFIVGALVMRRHYARIRAAEEVLRKVVV